MDNLIINEVNEQKLEEIKNKGNDLFKIKKYGDALDAYLNVLSLICNDSVNSKNIKKVVNFFQTQNIENIVPDSINEIVKTTESTKNERNKVENTSYLSDYIIIKNIFIKVCHNISLCYYFLEQFNKAIEYCLYINETDKDHFKSYHTLGLCYEKLEDYKKCIIYFDRCKSILLNEKKNINDNKSDITSISANNKKKNNTEINKINEKIKKIMKLIEQKNNVNINDATNSSNSNISIDTIKSVLCNEKASEEDKIKMLHCMYNQKIYILLKENIFQFIFDLLNRKNISIAIEQSCVFCIYKILSILEAESFQIEKEKASNNSSTARICINRLDNIQFQYYYNPDFIKLLISFNNIYDEKWITNYIKSKNEKLENYKFTKEEKNYKNIINILMYIINILKYIYVIDKEQILKIINLYYINNDINEIAFSGLNAIIFLCKKKQFFIASGTKKGGITNTGINPIVNSTNNMNVFNRKKFLETLKTEHNIDITNNVIVFHFSDPYKYPVCINTEIKKFIQTCISLYDYSQDDVEYALVLLFTLLYDKNRPSEKDTDMNDMIYEYIDSYFHGNKINIKWFIYVKCLFLVNKDIILNYLIGKNEYILQILNCINNGIGREHTNYTDLSIDVLLLILNISELRLMLNDYIYLYVQIIKTLNYDKNFLKLLIGSFKLYMHSIDFKKVVENNIDLFFYSKEMVNEFLLTYDQGIIKDNNEKSTTIKTNKQQVNNLTNEKIEDVQLSIKGEYVNDSNKGCLVREAGLNVTSTVAETMKDKTHVQNNGDNPNTNKSNSGGDKNKYSLLMDDKKTIQTNYNIKYDDNVLKNMIELLFYLSLHIEFKRKLLKEENNYILFFLIKIGDDINKKKLDNTYKYIYCNTIYNLILTRTDEKMRKREINKANLANFDHEQIEALEQFYDKLHGTAKTKLDPLYDYGDEETSNKIISLLLYTEKCPLNTINNKKNTTNLKNILATYNYKNGSIINIIYNFINISFFTTNIAEAICDILSKFVKDYNNIGIVLVNNGLKSLLLASKHICKKKNCALALSEIFIYTNPKLIHFYEAYDSLSLLIDELNNDEEIVVFKCLMAITNILTVDENIGKKAMQLKLWSKCFETLSSENEHIKLASLECICNLCSQTYVHQYIYDKYQKITKENKNNKEINFVDIQIIFAFTMEEQNYKFLFASTGALAMLSHDTRLPSYLVRTKNYNNIFSSLHKSNDQNILIRILTFLNNIILGENVPNDVINQIKEKVQAKTGLNDENKQLVDLIIQ
ncbi:tetratricopeptide repeat family protein, putative [Hepatocystis sp. ex Piliocolobus tephrosceles]|nr:tetratricopeptide repeat family protein, putative [Hepatocystis sp. ex Piliocolobus tephrosceles]